MCRINLSRALCFYLLSFLLLACQPPNFTELKEAPTSFLRIGKNSDSVRNNKNNKISNDSPLRLGEILDGSLANKNQGSDFIEIIKFAINKDPNIISARRDLEAKLAAIKINEAQKDFQVGTTFYGGIEDVTDNTKGVALAFNASRLVFDGGKLDYQIESAVLTAEAAKMSLAADIDMRAFELCQIWLELEKYKKLQKLIDARLQVLDPLIAQLEQVAKAGIGDVSKVTAAQRTVSAIRVEKTNITEGLAQAEVAFMNALGSVDSNVGFDYDFISSIVPAKFDEKIVQNSPMLLSQYAIYQAALAQVKALRARDSFDVGFEARAMRPFAGSGYDSDESIGFVGRKTLFNGDLLESQLQEAGARAEASQAQIQATYRQGARAVRTALQNIKSMEQAILIAKDNAKLTSDEIIYLRQQLIIGGSTLNSVLSSEATLYEAESKEIKFLSEKYKSQLIIVSSLGLLGSALGF